MKTVGHSPVMDYLNKKLGKNVQYYQSHLNHYVDDYIKIESNGKSRVVSEWFNKTPVNTPTVKPPDTVEIEV